MRLKRSTSTRKPEASNIDQVFASLIEAHGVETAHGRAVAWRAAQALVEGGVSNLSEAVKALSLLPAPRVQTRAERTISADAVKAKLMEAVMNEKAADHAELCRRADRGERLSEVELASARLYEAELRAEGREVEHVEPVEPPQIEQAVAVDRAAEVAALGTGARPSPIDVPTGDIVPPGERDDLPANQRMHPGADDAKAQAKRNAPVIDATPVPWDETPSGKAYHEWVRTHPDWDVLLW